MPAKTISQLTQATTINGTDDFAIEQSGVTKRIAASVVRGDIANANIKSDAAIAFSKLAALNSAQILVGNGSNVPTAVDVTGDVTISNAGVTAIGNAKVLPAMLSGAQTGSAPIYGCRAWVNFDGTTTPPSIRASGNVTSVTRNATGDYTVTFTTAMPDANYSAVITHQFDETNTATPSATMTEISRVTNAVQAGSIRFHITNSSNTKYDVTQVMLTVIR